MTHIISYVNPNSILSYYEKKTLLYRKDPMRLPTSASNFQLRSSTQPTNSKVFGQNVMILYPKY